MQNLLQTLQNLPKEEQVILALRSLYTQYGYSRYRMSHFESYDMYLANKNFLKSEGIITFPDAAGRLMALKPDVTMSIVKYAKPEMQSKLYYIENVFRTAHGGSEIREISQMGVEYIGGADAYAEAEMVLLAAQSLAAVSEAYVLNLSHMGYVAGLLDVCGFSDSQRSEVLEAVRAKNTHALEDIASVAGCTRAQAAALAALTNLSGPVEETLRQAQALCCSPEMQTAVQALQALWRTVIAVCTPQQAQHLQLDFSVLNDMDYYNGLILQGYVQSVPHAVLAGGRYDNLLLRFGKQQAALGFALYLGELGRAFAPPHRYDVDTLLLYSPEQPAAQVAQAAEKLRQAGSVAAAPCGQAVGMRARRVVQLQDDGSTQEVAPC